MKDEHESRASGAGLPPRILAEISAIYQWALGLGQPGATAAGCGGASSHAEQNCDGASAAAQNDVLSLHRRRARAIAAELQRRSMMRAALAEVLDKLGIGVLAVERTGVIRLANQAAARLLDRADVVSEVQMCAVPRDKEARERLAAALSVCHDDPPDRPARLIVLPRSAAASPMVAAVRALQSNMIADPGLCIISIVDTENLPTCDSTRAAQIHDLTPRQAEVAAMAATGSSPAEIAAKLGLREGTVRTYLRDIRWAIGAHGLDQLVAALTGGLAWFGGSGRGPSPQ